MKKRLVSLLLCLALLMGLLPTAALAAGTDPVVANGEDDLLTWTLTEGGVLTISGTGYMSNHYSSDPAPWLARDLGASVVHAVIEEGVTTVGFGAFKGCATLEDISLPDGLEHIYQQAFQGCTGLKSIVIPDSVKDLGKWTFNGCSALESVTLPNNSSFTVIPEGLFQNCSALREIVLPETVTGLADLAFCDCTSLERINIPGKVKVIPAHFLTNTKVTSLALPEGLTTIREYGLFKNYQLAELTLPSSLTTLSGHALDGLAVTSFTIPGGVKIVEEAAMTGFPRCTELTLEEGVTTVEGFAYLSGSPLKIIRIPASVTSIADTAFGTVAPDCVIYGEPGSCAETFAREKGISFNGQVAAETRLALALTDENGDPIDGGYTVTWYDGDTELGTGNPITLADSGKTYRYTVTLGEALAYDYETPPAGNGTPAQGETTTVTLALTPRKVVTVTGKVLGKGGAVAGARVAFTQSFGPALTREVTADTDAAGAFSVTLSNVPTTAQVAVEGYYTKTVQFTPSGAESTLALDDWTLAPLPQSRVEVRLSLVSAALPGQTGQGEPVTSFDGLTFRVTRGGQPVSFTAQYPYLLFEDGVRAGDALSIGVTGSTATLTEPVSVELNGAGAGVAALTLMQNGRFQAAPGAGLPVTLMLFDQSGALVSHAGAQGRYSSDPLPAGSYTLVLMGRTQLLRSVSTLDALDALWLSAGTDYAKRTVTIQNGVITDLGQVAVPPLDEGKLYHTDAARTGVTVSRAAATVGSYITLRVEYALASETDTVQSLMVTLPEGLTQTGGVTLDGETVNTTWDSGARVLRVPTESPGGVLRLYFLAEQAGAYSVTAGLTLQSAGQALTQPLGTARHTATAAQVYAPATTSSKHVTVSGLALPGSTVTVYDNGATVGAATANDGGRWALTYELAGGAKYAYHTVYAEIVKDNVSITTEPAQMIYDAAYIGVSKVTMYNTADGNEQETVFDYLHPTSGLGYYFMTDPEFSFAIEFAAGADLTRISNVRLNVFAEDGQVYSFDTTPDGKGKYLASVSGIVPVNVGVEYSCAAPGGEEFDYSAVSGEGLRAYFAEVDEELGNLLEIRETGMMEDGKTGYVLLGVAGSEDEEAQFGVYVEQLDYSEFDTEEELAARNFVANEDKTGYALYSITDDSIAYLLVSPGDRCAVSFTVYFELFEPTEPERPETLSAYALPGHTHTPTTEKMSYNQRLAVDLMEKMPLPLLPEFTAMLDYRYLSDLLEGSHRETNLKLDEVEMALEMWEIAVCPDTGAPRFKPEDAAKIRQFLAIARQTEADRYDYWKSMLDGVYRAKILNAFALDAVDRALWVVRETKTLGDTVIGTIVNEIDTSHFDQLLDFEGALQDGFQDRRGYDVSGTSSLGDFTDVYGSPYYLSLLDAYSEAEIHPHLGYATLKMEVYKKILQCEDEPEPEPEPAPKQKSPVPDKDVGRDPSGYVCEAVASNRLEGVTATLYYRADEHADAQQWNAGTFGQQNPLTTDATGYYRWDVPVGQWQVKYEKAGYTTAHSDWLDVPPPQTDVNIALASESAPTVKSVIAYQDQVRIQFSRYMRPDTVLTDGVTVTMGGAAVSGALEAVDLENAWDNDSVQYASIYRFIPAGDVKLDGTVSVQIAAAVTSYNGQTLGSAWSGDVPVTVRPTELLVDPTTGVAFGEDGAVTLQLRPVEAAAGQTLLVTSASPSVVGVADQVTFDENGTATVALDGKLLGKATVSFALAEGGLTASTEVTVATGCAPVQFSLADGATVPSGTAVTLTTATEGAKIYYTLDKTCPCVVDSPSRTLYTGPITITEDTYLIAYAVKSGHTDSPTSHLRVTVAAGGGAPTGGSSPATDAPVVEQTAHGDTVLSPSAPAAGDAVTITPTPEAGYAVGRVVVVDAQGRQVAVTAGADGTYTFTQPQGQVAVFVFFHRADGQVSCDRDESCSLGGYADVDVAAWYHDGIHFCVDQGLMSGYGDGVFAPGATLTRGMLAQILYNKEGRPAVSGSDRFTDVPAGAWYAGAVNWAAGKGIVGGYGDGRYGPEDPITREQLAVILYRYEQSRGGGFTVRWPLPLDFRDRADVSDWAHESMCWMTMNRVLRGRDDGTLDPRGNATRAEAAAMLQRYIQAAE